MPLFRLIVLFLLFGAFKVQSQSGYQDKDTTKYSKITVLNIDAPTKTKIYYKGTEIRKICREFIGSTFGSTTIYYIKDGKLLISIYASLRKPHTYFEEHLYFTNDKLVTWVTSDNKKGVPGSKAFTDKEKLAIHFFEEELKEVKSKKMN